MGTGQNGKFSLAVLMPVVRDITIGHVCVWDHFRVDGTVLATLKNKKDAQIRVQLQVI